MNAVHYGCIVVVADVVVVVYFLPHEREETEINGIIRADKRMRRSRRRREFIRSARGLAIKNEYNARAGRRRKRRRRMHQFCVSTRYMRRSAWEVRASGGLDNEWCLFSVQQEEEEDDPPRERERGSHTHTKREESLSLSQAFSCLRHSNGGSAAAVAAVAAAESSWAEKEKFVIRPVISSRWYNREKKSRQWLGNTRIENNSLTGALTARLRTLLCPTTSNTTTKGRRRRRRRRGMHTVHWSTHKRGKTEREKEQWLYFFFVFHTNITSRHST